MLPVRVILIALAGPTLALALPPAPQVQRYLIDLRSETIADLSARGGGRQLTIVHMASWVTATLQDSATGRTLRVTVDSMRPDTSLQISPELIDGARGALFTGFVEPNGKIRNFKAVRANPLANELTALVKQFFPVVKVDAKVGDAWADTIDVKETTPDGSTTIYAIRSLKAVAEEPRNEVKALRIEATLTSKESATQESANGPVYLQGTGTGASVYYIGPDRRYLGGTSQQRLELTASSPSDSAGKIPLQTTNIVTVTAIK